ncbi:MAG: CHASE3 domain-containing protein, partial [Candidatus Competibacterales bacterium]|nr:CHASE3 domain-containing protein [Candidatus Competibacterales bacterium]
MRLTLARKLLLVYLVLVGLVVAFALAIVYSSAQSRQIAATVEQTERRIMLLNGLLRDLLNAETGHRGYILTGEAPFLEPYEDALQHLPERIDALERQFQDRPAARRQLRLVAELAARKLRHMRHGIGLERAGQEAMASAQVASGEGKQLMDRLRAEIDAMISAQNRELLQFQNQRNRALTRLTGILLAVGLLVLGGVAVLGRLLVADLGRRLAHLNEATQRFGAGDLDARVTVSGHDELTRLGHSFNEMADLVAEFQQSLSASDQRLRTILDTVVDAVVTIDSDGRIVAANRATSLLFGHSEAALLGQPVGRLFERESRTASLLHEIHALGTDRSDSANQLTGCHSDGHRFPVDVGTAVTRLGDEELLVCV